MAQPQILGRLRCQANSYLSQLETKVVSCVSTPSGQDFLVEFEDTVLFPEGGGQPCDQGTAILESDKGDALDTVDIRNVQRDGLRAVHTVSKCLPLGSSVRLNVNWNRRFDHMQQHTGQHLLSAVIEKLYGVNTVGWAMASSPNAPNYIELSRKLTNDEVNEAQANVTDWISRAMPVNVNLTEKIDPEKGAVRIVVISGIEDANPCCGTHLGSTAEIGPLFLFHQQNIRGSNARLFFMVGNRAVAQVRANNALLRELGAELSCNPADLVSKVNFLSARSSALQKQLKQTQSELAKIEGKSIKGGFVLKQDADFLRLLAREVNADELTSPAILLSGSTGESGVAIVIGKKSEEVQKIVSVLQANLSQLKGGGRGTIWQGKVTRYEKSELEAVQKALSRLEM